MLFKGCNFWEWQSLLKVGSIVKLIREFEGCFWRLHYPCWDVSIKIWVILRGYQNDERAIITIQVRGVIKVASTLR